MCGKRTEIKMDVDFFSPRLARVLGTALTPLQTQISDLTHRLPHQAAAESFAAFMGASAQLSTVAVPTPSSPHSQEAAAESQFLGSFHFLLQDALAVGVVGSGSNRGRLLVDGH